jgi:LDH2 family malate/lactate/ureidoglycolate dehydrogenase
VCGEEYHTEMAEYVERIKNSRAAEGSKIAMPGEDRINYRKNREV